MSRRKTHEEFVEEVEKTFNGEITILTPYINRKTRVLCRCNKCGDTKMKFPYNITKYSSCKKCALRTAHLPTTIEDFKIHVSKITDGEYTVLSYIQEIDKYLIKHDDCGYEYKIHKAEFKRGKRCRKCAGTLRKTTESFKAEVLQLTNGDYLFLGEYKNSKTKGLFKHLECGEVFEMRPNNFLGGQRCIICNESKGEQKIRNWLSERQINFETQYPIKYHKAKNPLFLDFLVSSIAIEFDGEQHFIAKEFFGGESALQETRRRDRNKDKYCADNGIPLIRIPYWEYDNIDAILTEKLLPLLSDSNAKLTEMQAC